MTSPVTADYIEARLIEAVETERRLPKEKLGPAGARGFWPEQLYSFADRVGWDEDRRIRMERARNKVIIPPTAAAIARWEEVVGWICLYITDPIDRMATWAWAEAKIGGGSFIDWCREEMPELRKKSMTKQAGWQRRKRGIVQICSGIGNNERLLSQTVHQSELTIRREKRINLAMVAKERDHAEANTITPEQARLMFAARKAARNEFRRQA